MTRRDLQGKRAILTGASSGIGRELALALAHRGVSLVLVARREERLQSLAREIESSQCGTTKSLSRNASSTPAAPSSRGALPSNPPDCNREASVAIPTPGDITHPATRAAAITAVGAQLGGLDLLINNAGTSAHGRFADAGEDRLRRIMEVNFFAAAELTREAVPLLQQGRQPVIVNVGSVLGRRGAPRNSEYCASKFALAGWSEAIRPELARLGIDVLLVNPGTTDTEFFDHLIEKTGKTPWPDQHGSPADKVAAAIVRAIELGKHEIVPSWKGRTLVWLNRAAPRLADRLMQRWG